MKSSKEINFVLCLCFQVLNRVQRKLEAVLEDFLTNAIDLVEVWISGNFTSSDLSQTKQYFSFTQDDPTTMIYTLKIVEWEDRSKTKVFVDWHIDQPYRMGQQNDGVSLSAHIINPRLISQLKELCSRRETYGSRNPFGRH